MIQSKNSDWQESNESLSDSLRLQGQVEHLIYVDCLQRFAKRMSFLCDSETQGEVNAKQALDYLKLSLDQLSSSKQDLGIC